MEGLARAARQLLVGVCVTLGACSEGPSPVQTDAATDAATDALPVRDIDAAPAEVDAASGDPDASSDAAPDADVEDDACEAFPCFPGVECTDLPDPGTFTCGPCPDGSTGDGQSCIDVNECVAGTDDCVGTQRCYNVTLSFLCIGEGRIVCLDGVEDRATAGDVTAQLATRAEVTFELWFRSTNPTGEQEMVDLLASEPDRAMRIAIGDGPAMGFDQLSGRAIQVVIDARANFGALALNARGFDIDAALSGFDETAWHHYAVVFDGTTQRAFVDGIELTSAQQRDGIASTTLIDAFGPDFVAAGGTVDLHVGWFAPGGNRFLAGELEDLRVSSTARFGGPFLPLYPMLADDDTLLRYPLDEGAGSQSLDDGPHDLHITWSGDPWTCAP